MTDLRTTRAWRVTGRVQGVGFRWWAVQTGARYGLVGRVWNDADGSVVLHARGDENALDRMEESLWVGPLMARVAGVETVPAKGPWPDAGIEVAR